MRGHLLVAALSGTASATTYALTVYAPGTALNGMDLNAAEQSFFTGMGGKPQTYCPDSIRYTVGCPPEEGTLVNGLMLSMAVSTPGDLFLTPPCPGQTPSPCPPVMLSLPAPCNSISSFPLQ